MGVIGEQIKKYRIQKKYTQENLGSIIGVTTQAVSKWERGGTPDAEILPALADALGVSRNILDKRFHADLNRAIGDEIKRQRIATAKLLLKNSGASIAEIAERTGFCTPSHLTNTFRSATGFTPRAWRAKG